MTAAERRQLTADIRATVSEALETAREEWVTGAELSRRFGCFTPWWLKTYGQTLPRTRAGVIDGEGRSSYTGWVYPAHKISRLLNEGRLECLPVERLHRTEGKALAV